MKTSHANTEAFQEILERKETEFARALRNRDDIAIEKSANQMDEIQRARRNETWRFETWPVSPTCCVR